MREKLVLSQVLETGAFEDRVVHVQHRLHALPLFTDEGLTEIIGQHPRHALSICGMSDRVDKNGWTEGELGDLSGQQILEAMHRGRFWLNVREIYRHQSAFRQLINQLYAELRRMDPRLDTIWRNATLLISSPSAYVNYHLDIPCNLLWHIRGVKRVWMYPRDEEAVVTAADLAATVAQEQTEMLRYAPEMDRLAWCCEMHPGDMVSWPQNSPHRVDNIEGLNVSLSTEHLTRTARRRIRVLQANHYLRTRLGLAPRGQQTRGLAATAKIAGATALLTARKLAGTAARGKAGYPVTFRVDPAAPESRVNLA